MDNLSLILWRERELLDTLLFKLEQEQLILASGRTRWLARCAGEVEAVLEAIRETEVLRAVAADAAAASIGLRDNSSLRALADAAEEPWCTILADHRDAFAALTAEILELAGANRDLISAGFLSARETLKSLAEDEAADGYSPDGSAVVESIPHRLLDRSL